MSDINKLVAAILTAGRVPTMSKADEVRPADDWLAEYRMWLDTLENAEAGSARQSAKGWGEGMIAAIQDETSR